MYDMNWHLTSRNIYIYRYKVDRSPSRCRFLSYNCPCPCNTFKQTPWCPIYASSFPTFPSVRATGANKWQAVTKAAAGMAAQNRPISCHSSVKVLLASCRTPRPSSNPATKSRVGLNQAIVGIRNRSPTSIPSFEKTAVKHQDTMAGVFGLLDTSCSHLRTPEEQREQWIIDVFFGHAYSFWS